MEVDKKLVFMNLHAQWIVGFVDGEGCFHVALNKNPQLQYGFQILPEFTVVQHERDVHVLHALKTFFGCGTVRKHTGNCCCYRVRSLSHFSDYILPFFEKHPLKTQKNVDFLKFRDIINILLFKPPQSQEEFDLLCAQILKLRKRNSLQDKVQLLSPLS